MSCYGACGCRMKSLLRWASCLVTVQGLLQMDHSERRKVIRGT
jgi:hypothetical protein